jgi:hypothetical protein
MLEPAATINLQVELFGLPRLHSGRREVVLSLTPLASRQEVIRALAEACPTLIGQALRNDLSDLQDGYVFSHNGIAFLGSDHVSFQSGDILLLLSNQAGG